MKAIAGAVLVLMVLAGCGSAPTAVRSPSPTATSNDIALPDVGGKTLANATITLSSAGLSNYSYYVDGKFTSIRSGDFNSYFVVSTEPDAGSTVTKKDLIYLHLKANPANPPTPSLSAASPPTPTPSPTPKPIVTASVPPPPPPAAPKQVHVTYIVEADGPIGTITYTNFVGNKIGQEQSADEIWGPVEKSYNFDAFGFESSYGFWSLGVSAQAGAGTSTITCHILRDGREISKQTSTGQYSVVTCNVGG
ncbi:hypothetical protein QFZ35_003041 [Arthrobacter ulcerisalmonis]|nr:hypothetical protein [Arthrobacter ulcerisalmonis]